VGAGKVGSVRRPLDSQAYFASLSSRPAASAWLAAVRALRPLLLGPFGLATLGLFAVARVLQLSLLGPGIGNDVHLYQRYASAWGAGAIPYVGFQPEYPPGALPLFIAPWLYGGPANYVRAFAIEMGLFDLGAYLLVGVWARRRFVGRALPVAGLLLLYLLITLTLYPVIYTRFDMVPGALVLGALVLAYRPGHSARALGASAVLLGLAGAIKLWPLALGPAWLLLAWRRGRWRQLVTTGLWFGVGIALCVAPLLPTAGLNVLKFLGYHAARGIEIGSTWASLALLLNLTGVYEAWTAHDFGAFHVKGPAADVYARWSMIALPLGVLLPQIGAFFGRLGRDDDDGDVGAQVALGTVLGFMVFGKVLSPQFTLWIAPLLPLVCPGAGVLRTLLLSLVALGIAVGTTIEYPFVAPALEMLAPGHTRAVLLVAGRNALLAFLFVYLCFKVGWNVALSRAWAYMRARVPSARQASATVPHPPAPPPSLSPPA
jgi:hypothetical protein